MTGEHLALEVDVVADVNEKDGAESEHVDRVYPPQRRRRLESSGAGAVATGAGEPGVAASARADVARWSAW